MATIEDFHKLDIRAGTVLTCEPNPKATRPAYSLTIDLGDELGTKTSSAQLTEAYTPESLIGRTVLAVTNLPPRRVAGVKSEVLVLGLYSARGQGPVILITPDAHAPEGAIEPGDRLG